MTDAINGLPVDVALNSLLVAIGWGERFNTACRVEQLQMRAAVTGEDIYTDDPRFGIYMADGRMIDRRLLR